MTDRLDTSSKVEELLATYLEGLHNPSDDGLYNELRAKRDTEALKAAITQLLQEERRQAEKGGFYAGQANAGVELYQCHENWKRWDNPALTKEDSKQ